MADEGTFEKRREQDHQRTEPETGELPEIGPLDGIAKFLFPRREPTEFTGLENPLEGSVLDELIKDPWAPPDQLAKLPSTMRLVLWAASRLKVIGLQQSGPCPVGSFVPHQNPDLVELLPLAV